MTTSLLALPLSSPIPDIGKKKRVLLIDASSAKRELRAEAMRKLGMDVDCAADISEARCWWKADLYNLVLVNLENERGHRDKFCDDVRSAIPHACDTATGEARVGWDDNPSITIYVCMAMLGLHPSLRMLRDA